MYKINTWFSYFSYFHTFHTFILYILSCSRFNGWIWISGLLKTGSHFFHREPFYLLKIFLEIIFMVKVHKIAEMCQILAYFSFYYCKSLSNTFLSWGTPKWGRRRLRFESCGYFDVIFHLKGSENDISNFWHNETP